MLNAGLVEPRALVDTAHARDWWKPNPSSPSSMHAALGPVLGQLPLALGHHACLRHRAGSSGKSNREPALSTGQRGNPVAYTTATINHEPNMMTIKQGDQGIAVHALQLLLNSYLTPPPNLREDGEFGSTTREVVKRLQKQKGLPVTGEADVQTWVALGMSGLWRPMAALSSQYSWIRVAHAELLVHQIALPGQHNMRIVEYHQTTTLKATDDETAWCSAFVNWVMEKAGYAGTGSAAAKSWMDWGVAIPAPREGAVTVVKKKSSSANSAASTSSGFHVAFLVYANSSTVRLLGGNQSSQVKYSDFPLNDWEVKGYRWPS